MAETPENAQDAPQQEAETVWVSPTGCSQCAREGVMLYTHNNKKYCAECIKSVTLRTEVYSRIVGYLRPVQLWNDAKRQEFRDRVTFDVGQRKSPG